MHSLRTFGGVPQKSQLFQHKADVKTVPGFDRHACYSVQVPGGTWSEGGSPNHVLRNLIPEHRGFSQQRTNVRQKLYAPEIER